MEVVTAKEAGEEKRETYREKKEGRTTGRKEELDDQGKKKKSL